MKVSQRKIALLLLVLAILGAAFFLVPHKRPFQTYLNKAETAFQNKNFSRSITLYLRAIKNYPKNERKPEILINIGDIYNFSLGNIEQAQKAYQTVIDEYPRTTFARKAMQQAADMLAKAEDFQGALLYYQRMIDDYPAAMDHDVWGYQVAMMALKLKRYEPARRSLMAIIEKYPETPLADEVLYQIGNIFFMEGAPRESMQVLRLAVQKYPESKFITEMKFTLANAYEELGKRREALELYRSILSTYPNPQLIEHKIENIVKNSQKRELRDQQIQEMKTLRRQKGTPKTEAEKPKS